MNAIEALRSARQALSFLPSEEAEAEARHILSTLLNTDIPSLYIMRDQIPRETEQRIADIAAERRSGRPLAYILRERWFMGYKFYVDERVLIPRQETELLVEAASAELNSQGGRSALDICTGSGAIAVSIKKLCPDVSVFAGDISEAALSVAQKNAQSLSAEVSFYVSDLFAAFPGKYDVITANPPYVTNAEYETLSREVRDHEPELALTAGEDGLSVIKRLVSEVGAHLNPGGVLFMEIGCFMGGECLALCRKAGFTAAALSDLSGRTRIIRAAMPI